MALGVGLLAILAVLLVLALVFATAQKSVTRWFFKKELPWAPLFWVTLSMGAIYAVLTTALATVLGFYATFICAPLGILVHALLVRKCVPDVNGNDLPLRDAILGQALTMLMFAAQHSPILLNLLRGSS